LIVEAYDLDVLREPRILDADINGHRPALEELCEGGKSIVLAANSPCSFLGNNGLCTIYPTRPNVCVGFEPGDEQCQQARDRCGLPPLQPVSA
jgi:Fe-S-cluster containining protein